MGRASRAGRDWALKRAARRVPAPEIIWEIDAPGETPETPQLPLRAAE